MFARFSVLIQLDEVIIEEGKSNRVPGACGDTFSQLLEKYGATIGTDTGRGCTNCIQIFSCQIFDWKKALQLTELKKGKEEDHF